jgi:steroid delta-isomerase-like uncharacterized protein
MGRTAIHEIMSELEANAQLARDLITAWNERSARRVAAFFSEDYVGEDVSVQGQMRGPRDVRRYVAYNLLGFPDLHFEVHDTIAQGDSVALVWTVTGTHKGRVMNIPPTGAKISAQGVSILTIRAGRIVHSRRVWDVAGMLRHIGLLPDLPALHD